MNESIVVVVIDEGLLARSEVYKDLVRCCETRIRGFVSDFESNDPVVDDGGDAFHVF